MSSRSGTGSTFSGPLIRCQKPEAVTPSEIRARGAPGTSEVLLSLGTTSPAEVDATIDRARAAGARVVSEPQQQPWGYTGTFADPDHHLWEVIAVS